MIVMTANRQGKIQNDIPIEVNTFISAKFSIFQPHSKIDTISMSIIHIEPPIFMECVVSLIKALNQQFISETSNQVH